MGNELAKTLMGSAFAAAIVKENERIQQVDAAARNIFSSTNRPMKVAFCGHYKTGKSSLINATRGKRNCDPGAAKADVVECTTTVTKYSWVANVHLFDVAGSGTMACPTEGYFSNQHLSEFDCVVIMAQGSVGEDEVAIARECESGFCPVPVIFVRSKRDQDLHNLYEDGEILAKDISAAKQLVEKLTRVHREKIRAVAPDLATVPFFCVAKNAMYNFINGTNSDGVFFQEREFITKLSDIEAQTTPRLRGGMPWNNTLEFFGIRTSEALLHPKVLSLLLNKHFVK